MYMEMNFPHLETGTGAYNMHRDYRAYLASANSRQGGSATARAMLNAAQNPVAEDHNAADNIETRIQYFAAALFPHAAVTKPYGAFLPKNKTEFGNPANYDQAVYQDNLVNGKLDSVSSVKSELQITKSGQEN